MRGQRLEVSSLFHARSRKRTGPSERSIPVEIGLPRLGSARLDDVGESLRMWLSDGASFDVPKSCVKVMNRAGSVLQVDWNGERVHMGFGGPITAWRATRMMTPTDAGNENGQTGELDGSTTIHCVEIDT